MRHKHIFLMFPLILLLSLCLTAAASATDGYALLDFAMDGASVRSVRLTAPADCTLAAASYSPEGQLLQTAAQNISGNTAEQSVPLTLDSVPDGGYARFFLLNSDTSAPLCKQMDTRDPKPTPTATPTPSPAPVSLSDFYAILYSDGEFVFQNDAAPRSNKTVAETYTVDPKGYTFDDDYRPTTPWYDQRGNINTVIFADIIQPQSTAYWFDNCKYLKNFQKIENLDTSNVTDMSYMFGWCGGLTELDVSGFDTSNVTNMSYMFGVCKALTELDVSGFDTSNVTDMSGMFIGCGGLTELDVSGFDTSNVTYMGNMFSGCGGLTELDVSGFDTSNVTYMREMFNGCGRLRTIFASDQFVTDKVRDKVRDYSMFRDCTNLIGGNGTQYDADHTNAEYARIDAPGTPGYFTLKA